MRTSPEFAKAAAALAAAQAAIGTVVRDRKNDDYKSKYATRDAIIEVLRPALAVHGISIIQDPDCTVSGQVSTETTLLHSSGEWIAGGLVTVPVLGRMMKGGAGKRYDPDPQAIGIAITYSGRYSLGALCAVAAGDDNDGALPGRNDIAEEPEPHFDEPDLPVELDPSLMPLGGPTQKGKPIITMDRSVLRAALTKCRERKLDAEAKIIAAELTRRALGGDQKSETVLREESDKGLNLESVLCPECHMAGGKHGSACPLAPVDGQEGV